MSETTSVVVEARTLEVTKDGRLRQPAYLGVRTDLTPEDLLGEAAELDKEARGE